MVPEDGDPPIYTGINERWKADRMEVTEDGEAMSSSVETEITGHWSIWNTSAMYLQVTAETEVKTGVQVPMVKMLQSKFL